MNKHVCDVLKCNVITRLGLGTDFRISSDHAAIFIVCESVHGFKSPEASISEH